MAEFCKKCFKKYIGDNPDEHPEWIVEDGWICEGCGYKYLNIEHPLNHTKIEIYGDKK